MTIAPSGGLSVPYASTPGPLARSQLGAGAECLWWAGHHPTGVCATEIAALTAEGHLQRVIGPIHAGVGTAVTRLVKARAVQLLIPGSIRDNAVLHGLSAAWFLACAPAPAQLHFMTHRNHRAPIRPPAPEAPMGWSVRQLLFPPQDVDHFHGLSVSTPVRTAADLACFDHHAPFTALQALLSAPHLAVTPEAVHRVLIQRRRLPHQEQGIMRLRRACRGLDLPLPAPAR